MATEMRQKAKKIVNRRGLGALANNTKWSEFFEEAKQLDVPFEFKMTTIWSYANAFGARCHFMLKAVEWGLTPFYWVEWIRVAETIQVPAVAAKVGLECVIEQGYATVYGYR
jgi:hypothetical protein